MIQDELMGSDLTAMEGMHSNDFDFDVLYRSGETRQVMEMYSPQLSHIYSQNSLNMRDSCLILLSFLTGNSNIHSAAAHF